MLNRRLFLNRFGQGAAAFGAAGWLAPAAASADSALGFKHINIGTTLALTGPLAAAGQEHVNTINAAFAQINKSGGVHGRELRLVSMDDAYQPARSQSNVNAMIGNNSVFALMSLFGTPNTAAVLPLTEKAGLPLLGPITGATSLRKAEHRYVFHTRSSYADEVSRMVQELVSMGLQDIAVVYLDNAFGKEVLADAQRILAENNLKAVTAIALAIDGKNAAQVAQQVLDAKAGAVFLGSTGTAGSDLVLAIREKAAGLPIVGLSVTFTDTVKLGRHVTGLAQASVVPSGKATKFAVVRDYQAALAAAKLSNPNGRGLDSWVNAHVLAEGIRRAGRDVTREKLRVALGGIRNFEVGEIVVNFNAGGPFVGVNSVKLGIYGADGVLRS